MFYKIKMDMKISLIVSLIFFGLLADAAAVSSFENLLKKVLPIHQFHSLTNIACVSKLSDTSKERNSNWLTTKRSRQQ